MAKLILTERQGADGTQFVVLAGEVTKVADGKGNAAGRVKTVTLKAKKYDKSKKDEVDAYASVAFWNSQDRDKMLEGKAQYADRITNAKVRPGVFLLVLAAKREDGTLTGLDFKYSGVITLRGGYEVEKDGKKQVIKDMNIIMGSVSKAVHDLERGVTRITIPTTGRDKETEFHSISVWNTDQNPQAAENAVKYLAPYEKEDPEAENGRKKVYKRAIFVCGENTHFGKPDGDGNSYTAWRYEFVPAANAGQQNGAGSPQADNTGQKPDADGFMDIPDGIDEELPFRGDSDAEDASEEKLPWEQ